jgi:hypothetical protein
MAGTFSERIGLLRDSIGAGHITAHCVVDQAYAQNQHETLTFHHPRGGRAEYLRAPMLENMVILIQEIANKVLDEEGLGLERAMIDTAEKFAQFVFDNAPKEIGELDGSGHPFVTRNGTVIYDRPPIYGRRPEGLPHI